MSNIKIIHPGSPGHDDFEFRSKERPQWVKFKMEITIAYLKKYEANKFVFRVKGQRATLEEAIKHLLSIPEHG